MEANILQLLLWMEEKIPKLEVFLVCLVGWFVVGVFSILGVFSTY